MTSSTTDILSPGEPAALGFDDDRLARAVGLLDIMTADGTLTGAALVVARRGQIVLERAAGLAAREPARPADARTLWLQASITKPVAGTAVMLLVERGLLTLDEPVARLLPAFGANGKERVTVRHLLTHTSGLDEGFAADLPRDDTLAERYAAGLYATGLTWPAGSRTAYNNAAFHLLAHIIHHVAGEPPAAFIRRELFEPLGLHDTFLAVDPATLGDRLAQVDDVDPAVVSRLIGGGSLAGGIVATPRDIAAFGQFFLNGGRAGDEQVLAPASIAAMLRDHAAGLEELDGEGRWLPAAGRGLAWRLNCRLPAQHADLASPAAFGHGGATGTVLVIDPTYDLVIAFAANRWGWPAYERRRLLNAVYGAIAD